MDVLVEGAGPLNTRRLRPPSPTAVAAAVFRSVHAQRGRLFLWTPVAFGLGCAAYFGAPSEPPLILAAGLALAALGALAPARTRAPLAASAAAVLVAFAAAGFLTAKLRSLAADAPRTPALAGVPVTGWVVDVDSPGASGPRLVIAPTAIGDLPEAALPRRIRVTVPADALMGPGAAVRFPALLNPPPGPASPGAFDFARNAYFDGIGGAGLALRPPVAVTLAEAPLGLRMRMAVNAARWSLTRRILEHIDGPAGGVAAAMITGHEAAVPAEQTQAMRDSGLAHIVSISGLHMAIVGGFVFFAVRLLIAAWPWLALRVDGKKCAAVAGLVAVGTYLAVSGAPPPAERAAITASVAFLAVLLERRAVSLRGLALAALIVMLLHPEAVTEPGFQMSFAATAALVALAEAWPRPPREINTPTALRLLQGAGAWLAVSLGVNLVAGLATTPFAVQHFNRVAVYGLLANLLTAPLSSFVFMPALAIGAVFAALGWPNPALDVASWGVERMLQIADAFAAAPGAVRLVPSAPAIALPTAFLGLLWVCLWKGRGRWLGLPFALAVNLWPPSPPPLLWAASDGSAAAVVVDGRAVPLRPDARAFAVDLWARRHALALDRDEARRDALFDCGRFHCLPRPEAGMSARTALWGGRRPPPPETIARLCREAEVVVMRAVLAAEPDACAGVLLLTGRDFARGGALELRGGPDGPRTLWAEDVRGRRPWTEPSGSGG